MWTGDMEVILERLSQDGPRIGIRTAEGIRERYPSYERVTDDSLKASAVRNVERGIQVIRERRKATPEELRTHAAVAMDRAAELVPVEDMLSAFLYAMGVVRDEFLDLALEAGVDPVSIVRATQVLWDLTEDITVQLALVHREADVAIAREDERHRGEFLRRMLSGSLSGAEVHGRATTYGLAPTGLYHALRSRPLDPEDLAELHRALREASPEGFFEIVDGDVVGVAPAPGLEVKGPEAIVALGPPAHLAALEPSFSTASRILDVAERFCLSGTLTLIDVAIHVVVVDELEIGDLLVQRYLDPLASHPGLRGVIEETLREYMANGFQLKQTARRLGIHTNTLRYRLHRFEEITGVELVDTEVLFQVWWALRRSQLPG